MRKNHTLSLPNILTYGRIIAVPLVVLCFFVEGRLQSSDTSRWTALAIFAIASIPDFFDGYLARIWQQTSTIGRMLDPIADKRLVSACLLLLAADGTILDGRSGQPSSSFAVKFWYLACVNISLS